MNISAKSNRFEKHQSNQYNNDKITDSDSASNLKSSVLIEEVTAISSKRINNSNIIQKDNSLTSFPEDSLTQWFPAMQSLLEEPPSSLPLQLISGGILFLLAFFVWAWFGEVENIGKARSQLIPRGETYKIESLESAKIAQIAVEEGQKVQAGQLIARLDSEQEAREVARLNKLLSSYQTELSQKTQLLEQVKVENQTHQIITQAELQAHLLAIDSAIAKAEVIERLLAQQKSEMAAYTQKQKRVEDLTALDRARSAQINLELVDHQQRIARLKPLLEAGAITQEAIFQAVQAQRQAQERLIDNKVQGISNISEQIFQSEQSAIRQKKLGRNDS